MTTTRAAGAYASLLHLYPRRFREYYGPDMTLLFAQQLDDEPAGRVWLRTIADIAVTVPTRHLEAHMNRSAGPVVAMLYASLSVAGLVLAVIGGTNLAVVATGVGLAAVAGTCAVAAQRRSRSVAAGPGGATAQWWKVLAAGAAVLVTLIAVTTATGEVSSGLWLPLMAALLSAIVAIVLGVMLGVAHYVGTRRPRSA